MFDIIHLCAVILGYAGAVLIIYGGFTGNRQAFSPNGLAVHIYSR